MSTRMCIVAVSITWILLTACLDSAKPTPLIPSTTSELAELIVFVEPTGKGRVDLAGGQGVLQGNTQFELGSEITLSAHTLDPAYVFHQWEGDLSGATPDRSLKMDVGKMVRSVFVESATDKTLIARFTAQVIAGPAPFTVVFEDNSVGEPKRREWDFDNNRTVDSSEKKPRWTYAQAGVYSVRLRVIRGGMSDLSVRE